MDIDIIGFEKVWEGRGTNKHQFAPLRPPQTTGPLRFGAVQPMLLCFGDTDCRILDSRTPRCWNFGDGIRGRMLDITVDNIAVPIHGCFGDRNNGSIRFNLGSDLRNWSGRQVHVGGGNGMTKWAGGRYFASIDSQHVCGVSFVALDHGLGRYFGLLIEG